MNEEKVKCPMIDGEEITVGECIENSLMTGGYIKCDKMPEMFKRYEDWKEICQKCKWHDY